MNIGVSILAQQLHMYAERVFHFHLRAVTIAIKRMVITGGIMQRYVEIIQPV